MATGERGCPHRAQSPLRRVQRPWRAGGYTVGVFRCSPRGEARRAPWNQSALCRLGSSSCCAEKQTQGAWGQLVSVRSGPARPEHSDPRLCSGWGSVPGAGLAHSEGLSNLDTVLFARFILTCMCTFPCKVSAGRFAADAQQSSALRCPSSQQSCRCEVTSQRSECVVL